MIANKLYLAGTLAGALALLPVLAYGPADALSRVKALGTWGREKVNDNPPVDLKLETIGILSAAKGRTP